MSIRVKGGTPLHAESLCRSCTQAHIVRGYSASEEIVVCRATYPGRRVPFAVRDCTGYVSTTSQVLDDMEKIAWVLEPRGPKRRAGFLPASEWFERQSSDDESELILDQNSHAKKTVTL